MPQKSRKIEAFLWRRHLTRLFPPRKPTWLLRNHHQEGQLYLGVLLEKCAKHMPCHGIFIIFALQGDYLMNKFWYSNGLDTTSNSITLPRGLFGVQILFLKIGFIQQVTVLPYAWDYLVYKFWSSNRLHTTSNSITVWKGLFDVQVLTFK